MNLAFADLDGLLLEEPKLGVLEPVEHVLRHWLSESLKSMPVVLDLEAGPWVAGGAVRRSIGGESFAAADIDVFFKDAEQLAAAQDALLKSGGSISLDTPYSETWELSFADINLVSSRFYASAQAVVDGFDMTMCQCITDGRRVLATRQALSAIRDKEIVFLETDSVPASLRRAVKYGQQGYHLADEDAHDFLKRHLGKPAFDQLRSTLY